YVSSVEHSFKSLYALFARAVYDHQLVKDFAKALFQGRIRYGLKRFFNHCKLLKVEHLLGKLTEPLLFEALI
ncbi:hypothetical protein CARUB_v10022277mg, partial [Capsella rubella]